MAKRRLPHKHKPKKSDYGVVLPDNPRLIHRAYDDGLVGCYSDPDADAAFAADCPYDSFETAFAANAGEWKKYDGKVVLNYVNHLAVDPKAFDWRQTTSDCVACSCAGAIDGTRAARVAAGLQSWVGRGSPSAIYGFRGHGGGGMSCSQAARFTSQVGGVLPQDNGIQELKAAGIEIDPYNGSLGARWGSSGIPAAVLEVCKQHRMLSAACVRSVEGVLDALAAGFILWTCGGEGWSSERDENGIARLRGGWPHSLRYIGFDATRSFSREILLVMANTWDDWNGGGHPWWGRLPTGAWLTPVSDNESRIGNGGTFVTNFAEGFDPIPRTDYPVGRYYNSVAQAEGV